jgi:hypothetical protein
MRLTPPTIETSTQISVAFLAAVLMLAVASGRKTGVRASEVKPKRQVPQSQGSGQKSKAVVVDTGRTYPNEPIELTDLRVGGKTVLLNQGIDGGADWLNGLGWKIKNISKKNILTIELYLMFPDIEARGGKPFVHPMRYGYDPKLPPNYNNSDVTEPLKPNESVRFVVSETTFMAIKPLLESKIAFTDLRHLRIRFELIVFDDDTAWSLGEEMRRYPGSLTWLPIQ